MEGAIERYEFTYIGGLPDIPYSDISDIRIEKRTISNAEMFLGAGNDANQQQEAVVFPQLFYRHFIYVQ